MRQVVVRYQIAARECGGLSLLEVPEFSAGGGRAVSHVTQLDALTRPSHHTLRCTPVLHYGTYKDEV